MGNESYLNHYVELLTSTMTDCIIRNVSLQANAKVTEEVLLQMEKRLTEAEELAEPLRKKIEDLEKIRGTYDNVKHQIQHIDTYRNELIREREAHQNTRNEYESKIKELEQKIEYLQLTPSKRKKVDEAKEVSVVPSEEQTKDGGSF